MARVLKGTHSFTCTPRVHPLRNEPNLPLPSQPKLVLIYRSRRDGRLSRPWKAELEAPLPPIRQLNTFCIPDSQFCPKFRTWIGWIWKIQSVCYTQDFMLLQARVFSLTISTVPMVPWLKSGSAFFSVAVKPTLGGGYTVSSLADYPPSCPATLVDPYVDQRPATRGPTSRNPPGIARCRYRACQRRILIRKMSGGWRARKLECNSGPRDAAKAVTSCCSWWRCSYSSQENQENQGKKWRSYGDGLRLNTHTRGCRRSICLLRFTYVSLSWLAALCETASVFCWRQSACRSKTERKLLLKQGPMDDSFPRPAEFWAEPRNLFLSRGNEPSFRI